MFLSIQYVKNCWRSHILILHVLQEARNILVIPISKLLGVQGYIDDLVDTLSKCLGGHPIFHCGLNLNSKIPAGKDYKQIDSTNIVHFPPGSWAKIMFKTCTDFIKHFVTMAKTQSAREASHYLTFTNNCKTFYSHVFVFV